MDTAARGIGLFFYLRRRREIAGCAIYLLVALLAFYLPDFPFRSIFLSFLYMPMGILFLYLPGVFANADQDLLSTRSSYPPHLLTLPVSTRSLAFWPMLFGVIIVPPIWLLFASIVLVPLGLGDYLWWPAALLAAFVAMLQAVSWSPLPMPYLRLVLLIVLLPALDLIGMAGQMFGWNRGVVCAVYLALVPVCGAIAMRGLHVARTGSLSEWKGWGGKQQAETTTKHHFATPLQAQIWMEWKSNGIVSSLTVLIVNVLLTLLFLVRGNDPSEVWGALGIGSIEIPMRMMACIIISLIVAVLTGGNCAIRKIDTLRSDLTLQPFLATRPLTCTAIITAKAISSCAMIATMWGVELLFLAGWLLSPARQGDHVATLGALLLPYMTAHPVKILAMGLICPVFLSWCLWVNNLWSELYGRKWLALVYSISVSGSMGSLVVLSFAWVPQHLPLLLQCLRWIPDIAAALCVVKLVLAARVFALLLRNQLVTARVLTAFACTWIAIAAVSFLSLQVILPTGQVTALNLACGIILFLPLVRLSLAPLALHANRHR